ncbi:hypothetical protein PQX77_002435 [Marasmius sp. AFHP31]|nr:hypothetical protein PQX77_002435 [Marasmius sp. AFHP31]
MDVHSSNIGASESAHIAVSHADRTVTVWKLSSVGKFEKLFNVETEAPFVPATIQFDENRNVYVFPVAGGRMLQLDAVNGTIVSQRTITRLESSTMGSVILDEANDRLIVSTIDRCELFSLSDLRHQKTLPSISRPVVPYPRQLTLTEGGTRFVTGTDSGYAIVYRMDRLSVEQKLIYPKNGLVQTVASYSDDDWTYIAIAGSSGGQDQDVLLYRRSNRTFYAALWRRLRDLAPVSSFAIMVTVLILGMILGVGLKMVSVKLPTLELNWDTPAHGALASTAVFMNDETGGTTSPSATATVIVKETPGPTVRTVTVLKTFLPPPKTVAHSSSRPVATTLYLD